ncbi:MAG: hypothetical protein AB1921_10320 [Thermodesulfobacteriota bacterium]
MAQEKMAVRELAKVTVRLRAGVDRKEALESEPEEITFVYGVGSRGITGLEYELAGKVPGDILEVSVSACQAGEVLGHLPLPAYRWFAVRASVLLVIEVLAVQESEPREVVQAMARAQEGCECGCGCGCGG